MTAKDSNPKTAMGAPKPAMSYVPPVASIQMAEAFRYGAGRYGAFNWREIGVSESVYYSAAHRHLMAWWDGENIDAESGCHHLAHVMACCAIVLDAQAIGKLTDDRPVPGGFGQVAKILTDERIARATEAAQGRVVGRHPELDAPYGATAQAAQDDIYAAVAGRPTGLKLGESVHFAQDGSVVKTLRPGQTATLSEVMQAAEQVLKPGDEVLLRRVPRYDDSVREGNMDGSLAHNPDGSRRAAVPPPRVQEYMNSWSTEGDWSVSSDDLPKEVRDWQISASASRHWMAVPKEYRHLLRSEKRYAVHSVLLDDGSLITWVLLKK